jgi:hypothetical protein
MMSNYDVFKCHLRARRAAVFAVAFVLVGVRPITAQQPTGVDAAATPALFSVELEPQEIITTDLKRLILRDCGKITFEVRDPGLVTSFGGASSIATRGRLAVISARRAILADKSSDEVRDHADAVRDEIRRLVDAIMKDRGVAVADMPGDLRTCAVPVRPPE